MIDGQVALRIGGVEHTRLARGEAFGEISALLGEPVSGDLVALGPVGYIWLERERVRDFLVGHPELCYGMLQGEARRLRDPSRWYSSVSTRTPEPDWAPDSWRARPVVQQPDWPNATALELALAELRELPPLVFGGETRTLLGELGEVAAGRAFLLQAGDCAESFADLTTAAVHNRLRVILQMAIVLTYGSGSHIVKVARMAGQFAKPRSASVEIVDGVELPVYRGDMVNCVQPDPALRVPDPQRMLTAYHHAAAKLNLIRSLSTGGFGGLHQVHDWNRDFVAASPVGVRYAAIASEIERALKFIEASRIGTDRASVDRVDVFTSHEALLLCYEEALTRRNELTGDWIDTSAHMLWIGERTRALDSAHIEFLSGVDNPVGCKLGPTATAAEVVGLCERLNRDRVPGKLTLITRMGAARVAGSAAAGAGRRSRRGPSGRLGVRPDARQHGHDGVGPQDPPLRGRAHGGGDVLRGLRIGGGVARRAAHRADRRRRHRMPRRRRGPHRGRPRPPLRHHLRPAPQRASIA